MQLLVVVVILLLILLVVYFAINLLSESSHCRAVVSTGAGAVGSWMLKTMFTVMMMMILIFS